MEQSIKPLYVTVSRRPDDSQYPPTLVVSRLNECADGWRVCTGDVTDLHVPQFRARALEQSLRVWEVRSLVEVQVDPVGVWQDVCVSLRHLLGTESVCRRPVAEADDLDRLKPQHQ